MMEKEYRDNRYKEAYKKATLALTPSTNTGTRGHGLRAVVDRVNNEMLNSPNDKKLSKTNIHYAVQRGEYGVSPMKKGRPLEVPIELTGALARHAVMMQVSGDGEAASNMMHAIISALTMGTVYDSVFDVEYVWRVTRERHGNIINPEKQVNNEDRRNDWLTWQNVVNWNRNVKNDLVKMGMGLDKQSRIRKYY